MCLDFFSEKAPGGREILLVLFIQYLSSVQGAKGGGGRGGVPIKHHGKIN